MRLCVYGCCCASGLTLCGTVIITYSACLLCVAGVVSLVLPYVFLLLPPPCTCTQGVEFQLWVSLSTTLLAVCMFEACLRTTFLAVCMFEACSRDC